MCKLQQDRVKLLLLLLNHTVEKPPRLSEFWRLCCVKSLEESEGPISSGIKVHFSVGLAVWSLSGVPDDSNKLKRKKKHAFSQCWTLSSWPSKVLQVMLWIIERSCFDSSWNQKQRLELEQLHSDYEHLRTQERHKSRQLEDLTWVLASFQTFPWVGGCGQAASSLFRLTVICSVFLSIWSPWFLGNARCDTRLSCL